jgi:hypothetical protein
MTVYVLRFHVVSAFRVQRPASVHIVLNRKRCARRGVKRLPSQESRYGTGI